MIVEIKRINGVPEGSEYLMDSYTESGIYIVNQSVVIVNKSNGLVSFMCSEIDLNVLEEYKPETSLGVTEDFALRLTETILKNSLTD